MILIVLAIFLLGVFLSGFFSGNETGFYRASRVRFLMDGLDGDRVSKTMLRLFNNPTLFVATTLVGNNVANYLVSLAVVLGAGMIFTWDAGYAEIIAPIALSPALFVYGELLPKSIFYRAPNAMLRLSAPLFLFFTALFAPIAAVLWSLARLLEKLLGQSPEKVRFLLARRELQEVLQEGQEAGILHPTQRLLGQNFFLVASKPVQEVCTPLARVQALPDSVDKAAALRFARRHRLSEIPLYRGAKNELCGYARTVDLLVNEDSGRPVEQLHNLIKIQSSELFGEALLHMQTAREPVALVVSSNDSPIGLLSLDQLTAPLLKGPLGSLQR